MIALAVAGAFLVVAWLRAEWRLAKERHERRCFEKGYREMGSFVTKEVARCNDTRLKVKWGEYLACKEEE